MTLTLGYRRNTENRNGLHGVKLPVIMMSGAIAYSALLGGLVNYSAARDLTVSAFELSRTAEQEAAYAVPADIKADTATILDSRFPRVYLNEDAQVLGSDRMLAAAIGNAAKRNLVYLMDQGDEFSLVLMEDGTEGYIRTSSLSGSLAEIFDACSETKWIANDSAYILASPSADAAVAAEALYNEEVTITGTNDLQYWQVRYGDVNGYIDRDALMDEMYVEPEPEPEPVIETPAYTAPQANPAWNGQPLTRSAGVIYGPSGKETYYNLNMSGVIALMQAAGYNYEYWVRSDGVKMYGDYVMVACGFQVRPRGTIVESSLGTAICADTGTFSYTDPYQIDIAVDW